MSCKYCKDEKIMFEKEVADTNIIYWCDIISTKDLSFSKYGVFIDRGYLRLADLEDCNCLDHSEKIKINYCPICGDKINE